MISSLIQLGAAVGTSHHSTRHTWRVIMGVLGVLGVPDLQSDLLHFLWLLRLLSYSQVNYNSFTGIGASRV